MMDGTVTEVRRYGRALILLATLAVLTLRGGAEAQELPDPAILIEQLDGDWEFSIHSASRGELDRGIRSMRPRGRLRLDWIDHHVSGTNASGYLRYDDVMRRFEYEFETGSGHHCIVTGQLYDAQTIHFERDGTCPGEVLESFLRIDGPDKFVFGRSDLAVVASYQRAVGR